jgi:hypothetical protein
MINSKKNLLIRSHSAGNLSKPNHPLLYLLKIREFLVWLAQMALKIRGLMEEPLSVSRSKILFVAVKI